MFFRQTLGATTIGFHRVVHPQKAAPVVMGQRLAGCHHFSWRKSGVSWGKYRDQCCIDGSTCNALLSFNAVVNKFRLTFCCASSKGIRGLLGANGLCKIGTP